MLCFPAQLSSDLALPCETWNRELVHCACNTVQLLHCCRLLSPEPCPNSPELNALIIRFRESYSNVSVSHESKKIEEIKQWLVEFCQGTNRPTVLEWKMQLSFLPILPGSAQAQVIWGGIVKHLLIAYFIMVALCNRADHYISALWFLSSSIFFLFFPRLISVAANWMCTILLHMAWP